MFCGSKSFSDIEDGTHRKRRSSSMLSRWRSSSSKKTKKSSNKKNHLNPFSSRGVGKFRNLLAVLDAERRKILAERDNSTVLFAYSNSIHKWIPIIVNRPESFHLWEKKARTYHGGGVATNGELSKKSISPIREVIEDEDEGKIVKEKVVKKGSTRRGIGVSSHYLFRGIVFITLVLLCLALSGKTLAVCCTTALLSVMPAMTGKQNSSAVLQMNNSYLMKKKRHQYVRKTLSDVHNRSHQNLTINSS